MRTVRYRAAAAVILSLASTPVAAGPFISQYVEGSSNNKAIEIYNPGDTTLDLTDYQLRFYFNGSASAGTTVNLVGSIAPKSTFVVTDDSANPALLALANQTSSSNFFNGNDAVALVQNGMTLDFFDVIGQIGTDPGTEWGSGNQSTANNTLVRKPFVTTGDANGSDPFNPGAEWNGFVQDTFAGLGSHVCCGDLFISEYVEGTSNNKAIEIFNALSAPIDLSTYELQFFFNGSTSPGTTIDLAGTIGPGEVYVIADNDAVAAILAEADQTSTANFFNGNDAIALLNGGTQIDVFGRIGEDPGVAGWTGGGLDTMDTTLRRDKHITAGDFIGSDPFDPSLQWHAFPVNTFDGLGQHAVPEPMSLALFGLGLAGLAFVRHRRRA
jgi:predicted extracellular nuclease